MSISEEQFIETFKNSLPRVSVKLLGGQLYPPEFIKEVKVMPLTLAAEKRVLTQDYTNNSYKLIYDIVQDGLLTKIDLSALYLFDLEYLFNQIRIMTHGSKVNINYTCPHCSTKSDVEFDVSIVDINPPEKIEDIRYEMKDINLILEIPTVKRYFDTNDLLHSDVFINTQKTSAQKIKIVRPEDVDKEFIVQLAPLIAYVKSMSGQEIVTPQDYAYLILYILSLSRSRLLSLRTVFEAKSKVFNIQHEFKCPKCNTISTITLNDLGSEYFFPSNE